MHEPTLSEAPGSSGGLPTLTQDWKAYSAEQHEVWSILFDRRMVDLRTTASQVFLRGMDVIGLEREGVPNLSEVNRRLGRVTGWSAVAVAGFVPAPQFFASLAERRFPTTIIVRGRDQLDYLPEPDIFHDVFGHVPLHADQVFGSFLQRFGAMASAAKSPDQVTAMARLFWFTVEFGLILEGGEPRIYGSGLISSRGDGEHALGPAVRRHPFEIEAVLAQPFVIDKLQDDLFLIEGFDQLFEALPIAARLLDIPV